MICMQPDEGMLSERTLCTRTVSRAGCSGRKTNIVRVVVNVVKTRREKERGSGREGDKRNSNEARLVHSKGEKRRAQVTKQKLQQKQQNVKVTAKEQQKMSR